jgi:D-alanine-D-alanine ligase
MKKVLLLINSLSENPAGDELDVLVQAEAVEQALDKLGYQHMRVFCGLDLESVRRQMESESPDLVFNLVETVGGKGSLIHLPASLMESMKVPFTGATSYSLVVTTDKVRTKRILKEQRIPTPDWILPGDARCPDPEKRYIIKPIWEDGSAGITDESIVEGNSIDFQNSSLDLFYEEYIDGREFNITLLAGQVGPEVMPAAEMLYVDYPEDKPRILNYASKWDPGSFEYVSTIRSFDLKASDRELVGLMKKISLQCWDLFELRGYARIDFRVDSLNRPFVLEVNANPCLAPDAGFVAACAQGGISYARMIERIMEDA